MNILVIGNGFDLAHGLKTSYLDFFNFTSIISSLDLYYYKGEDAEKDIDFKKISTLLNKLGFSKNIQDKVNDCFSIQRIRDEMEKYDAYNQLEIRKGSDDPRMFMKFLEYSYDNYWINVVKKLNIDDQRWCYFEYVITKHLDALSWIEDNINGVYSSDYNKLSNGNVIGYLVDKMKLLTNDNFYDIIKKHKALMLKELDHLIELLGIYLYYFLDIPSENEFFKQLNVDRIMSFNYTSTYEDCYGQYLFESDKHYIHGELNNLRLTNNCNLILGIGSQLTNVSEINKTSYVGFHKYFQRIVKKTGNRYIKWIDEINEQKINSKIIFYGHSLDEPDGDIIKLFITNPYMEVIIIYHNDSALHSIIENLVKILDENMVIELTNREKVKFFSINDMDENLIMELNEDQNIIFA